jgi:glycine hydroxymethyltransferase
MGKVLDRQVFPGIQGGPLMHVVAAKAVAFQEALTARFRDYQRQTVQNAAHLARCLQREGIRLVAGGTDNHMMLVDLTPQGMTGKAAESILGRAAITVNKNAIPFDPQNPNVTSGIRIGTPVLTSRGMKTPEMETISGWIARLLRRPDDSRMIDDIRAKVNGLCKEFPLYPIETSSTVINA